MPRTEDGHEWNYRIIRYKKGGGYGLHEVFYDNRGEPDMMTERAIEFTGDTPDEVISQLKMALVDTKQPILDASQFDRKERA